VGCAVGCGVVVVWAVGWGVELWAVGCGVVLVAVGLLW
jgi:hypothetical protein